MELSEFVEKSLVAIVRGVERANAALKDSQALVNPHQSSYGTEASHGVHHPTVNRHETRVELVAFDVAVEASESQSNTTTGGAGGGIPGIAVIGGKMTGESEATTRHASRLRFSVPLKLPEATR